MDKGKILAELKMVWDGEVRQPGDVDAHEISALVGCTPEGARSWMRKFEGDGGTYKRFTVRGTNNKPMTVWRKVVV